MTKHITHLHHLQLSSLFNVYIGLRHLHLVYTYIYTGKLHSLFAVPHRPGMFKHAAIFFLSLLSAFYALKNNDKKKLDQ